MDHIDHLTALYDVKDRAVADIGAGKGHFSQQLAARGAQVTGIEIEAGKVAMAQARMPDGARVIEGRAEDLPLADGSQDLLCLIFSFHHIPVEVHDQALAEAVRVLKPGGHLHIVEPLAENCVHDPMKLIDDETYVRTRSHARINALAGEGHFKLIDSTLYNRVYSYDGFDSFIDSIIGVDPERAAKVPAARDEMEQLFYDKAIVDNGRYRMDDPCRAYHFAS
ncbi:MAG: class I SAM-dependent methyltransferase [Hyphomicrobiales bacterium]|nr:class I SAM-dependent methyltransferase [Hyphomicrobiales bacterium]